MPVYRLGLGKVTFTSLLVGTSGTGTRQYLNGIIELFRMGKKPIKGGSWQKELPLTRNLTIDSQLPLGWIRLTAIRKEREAKAVTQLEKGMQVEATVVKIGRPFSTVKLNGVTDSVKMSGTKEALRNPLFKEQAVVLVEIDLNKEGKVSQSRFIRVL